MTLDKKSKERVYIKFDDLFVDKLRKTIMLINGNQADEEKLRFYIDLVVAELILDANLDDRPYIPVELEPLFIKLLSYFYLEKDLLSKDIPSYNEETKESHDGGQIRAVSIGDTRVEYSQAMTREERKEIRDKEELEDFKANRISLYKRLVRRLRKLPW